MFSELKCIRKNIGGWKSMNVIKIKFEDVILIELKVFGDYRGFFIESYNKEMFK